jgi:hypothetical protein
MAQLGNVNGRMLVILSAVALFAILSSTMAKNPALPLLASSIGADFALIGQPDPWNSREQSRWCAYR